MNLDVFVVLFFGLLSQVYGHPVKYNCVEQHVGMYYVGENSTIYYVPKGNFNQKYMINIAQPEIYFMSYNNELRSLFFLNYSNSNHIYAYDVYSQHPYHCFLHWTGQRNESQYTTNIFGKESNLVSDPLTGNVFFIHKNNGIYVCDLTKKQCAEVLEPTQEKRRNLFLHPMNSVMYYIKGSYVKSARMDSQEIQIVSELNNVNDVLINVNSKGHLFNLKSSGQNTFYSDCKLYTMNNDSGLIFVHHLNGQNETVGTQKPNTAFMMDSEPSNEILSLKNFCKNVICDVGICVNVRTASEAGAKCLRNLTFEITKVQIDGHEFSTAPATTEMVPTGCKIFSPDVPASCYMDENGVCYFKFIFLMIERPDHIKCEVSFGEKFAFVVLTIIVILIFICACIAGA